MLILGLESSCDETAAAVVADGTRVLSNVVATQHALHERYGGVVPEIASRAHLEHLPFVVTRALAEAGVAPHQLGAVAVGNRPGLIGSLLCAVSAAKGMALSLGVPLLGIDHVQAHLVAADLGRPAPLPHPALGLVASGGHTTLYALESPRTMRRLGGTIDDAVGEAYDKAAVILGAGYPGGAALDRLAQRGDPARAPRRFTLGTLQGDGLDMTFSGLKTALLYAVRGQPVGRGAEARFERDWQDLSEQARADLAAAFQEAAIGTLVAKLRRGFRMMQERRQAPQAIVIGGGVAANSLLRAWAPKLEAELGLPVALPAPAFCGDNAAMLAALAWHRLQAGERDGLDLPALPSGVDVPAGRA